VDGQSLAYIYSREKPDEAHMAKVLTEDEARRITSNIVGFGRRSFLIDAGASSFASASVGE
jgi:hypothetical protein